MTSKNIGLVVLLFAIALSGLYATDVGARTKNKYNKQTYSYNRPKPKPTKPKPAPITLPPATTTPTVPPATPPPVVPPTVPSNETVLTAFITGYGYPDNTPTNSAAISHPVLHSQAGGIGTFADPITVAVGHSIINGKDILDYPAGTKFYIPNLRRYFIVEDTCGDGATPQNGPCHTGYPSGTTTWLDIWVGGVGATKAPVIACEEAITGNFTVIKNPASNYLVVPGAIYQTACTQEFGNTILKAQ